MGRHERGDVLFCSCCCNNISNRIYFLLLYKKSIILYLIFVVLGTTGLSFILSFIVAKLGYVHLFWVLPIVLLTALTFFIFIRVQIRRPLDFLKKDIVDKLGKGNLVSGFNYDVLKLDNEFGDMAKALDDTRMKFKVFNGRNS